MDVKYALSAILLLILSIHLTTDAAWYSTTDTDTDTYGTDCIRCVDNRRFPGVDNDSTCHEAKIYWTEILKCVAKNCTKNCTKNHRNHHFAGQMTGLCQNDVDQLIELGKSECLHPNDEFCLKEVRRFDEAGHYEMEYDIQMMRHDCDTDAAREWFGNPSCDENIMTVLFKCMYVDTKPNMFMRGIHWGKFLPYWRKLSPECGLFITKLLRSTVEESDKQDKLEL